MSIGKRILSFIKGLIVIALILLLAVLALRLTEANGAISLDGFRSGVGGMIPFVNTIFPDPDGAQPAEQTPATNEPEATPEVSEPTAEPATEPTAEPTALPATEPTTEPAAEGDEGDTASSDAV